MKKIGFLAILGTLSALAVALAPAIAGNRAYKQIKELEEQEEKEKLEEDK